MIRFVSPRRPSFSARCRVDSGSARRHKPHLLRHLQQPGTGLSAHAFFSPSPRETVNGETFAARASFRMDGRSSLLFIVWYAPVIRF